MDELTDNTGYADDVLERLMLQRRLEEFSLGARQSLLPAIAIIVAMVYAFQDVAPPAVVYGWALAQVAQLSTFVLIDRRFDPETASLGRLRAHWRRILWLQYLGTTIYAAAFPYVVRYAVDLKLILLGIVGTALFCGTLLVHRSMPSAARFHLLAMAFALTFTAFMVAGVQGWPTILLIFAFTAALLSASRAQERQFVAAARAEVERRDAEATVRMLLNDYEEHSSDWLWEIDRDDRLRGVSARFSAVAGRTVAAMEGLPIGELFHDPGEIERLRGFLGERRAFRDLLMELRVNGERRFWRLSARPRRDGRMSGVARDVTAARLSEERVTFMAHFDNLTGLANRYRFNERLDELLAGGGRSSTVALFYLDLDDFKAVNDTRGHLVGDRLLREVGRRLEQEVRSEDLVARLGGDEFAVIIESRQGAGMLIERAHRFLAVIREPYEIDDHHYRISSSVGIARCTDGDCDAAELMRRADLAMFAAKAKGRDNLALFEPALDRAARERREVETDLADALRRGEFRLHYQPVINLDSGKTTGYEALLRWYHPRRGVLAPGDFLERAEETGQIVAIGEWAIGQALAETAEWTGLGRLAINLSPTQVRSPQLLSVVSQALAETRFPPERLEFEITEHVPMGAGDSSQITLLKLREMGVSIALDDFGTGYSSLSYLRQFPFDRIKIDRNFVEDIETSVENQAIVSSITRLADALGMHTTAEGIERREQLDMLRKLGCQEAQGFLICAPVPSEDLPEPGGFEHGFPSYGSAVVDYRRAREAVLRRRGGHAA